MLPCSQRLKNELLAQIRCNLERYRELHPDLGFAELRKEFGEPHVIAAAYVESAGTAEILKALRIRKRIVAIVAAVMAAALLLWAATVTWAIVENRELVNGHLEVSTTEISP